MESTHEPASHESEPRPRRPVTLAPELLDRVEMMSEYAAMHGEVWTVEEIVDGAVSSYMNGFSQAMSEQE